MKLVEIIQTQLIEDMYKWLAERHKVVKLKNGVYKHTITFKNLK